MDWWSNLLTIQQTYHSEHSSTMACIQGDWENMYQWWYGYSGYLHGKIVSGIVAKTWDTIFYIFAVSKQLKSIETHPKHIPWMPRSHPKTKWSRCINVPWKCSSRTTMVLLIWYKIWKYQVYWLFKRIIDFHSIHQNDLTLKELYNLHWRS